MVSRILSYLNSLSIKPLKVYCTKNNDSPHGRISFIQLAGFHRSGVACALKRSGVRIVFSVSSQLDIFCTRAVKRYHDKTNNSPHTAAEFVEAKPPS